jgi:hypothetical protein
MDVTKLPLTDVERVKILRDALLRAHGALADIHAADAGEDPEMRELLIDLADVLIKTRSR